MWPYIAFRGGCGILIKVGSDYNLFCHPHKKIVDNQLIFSSSQLIYGGLDTLNLLGQCLQLKKLKLVDTVILANWI